MSQLKELLIEELQDLLHAETQLTAALPKMAQAAKNPKVKEAFEKHLTQTEHQIERLNQVFDLLGEKAEPRPCKAMAGLIAEGQEKIQQASEKDAISSDLALITAAQKVEHYEISGYGTVRSLARLLNENEAATLLSHTLGEEESTDFLLSQIAKPLLQELRAGDLDKVASKRTQGSASKRASA